MVGLVQTKMVVKSVAKMLKEHSKDGVPSTEDNLARQFVKRMRNETKERDKLKEEAKRKWEGLQDKLKFAEV